MKPLAAIAGLVLLLLGPAVLGQGLSGARGREPFDRTGVTQPGNDEGEHLPDRETPLRDGLDRGPDGGGDDASPDLERPPEDEPDTDPGSGSGAPLPAGRVRLVRHEVEVRILDGAAVTTVERTFRNDSYGIAETVFEQALPENAVVTGFSLREGVRDLPGALLEIGKAREIYAGRRMPARGLLELAGGPRPGLRARLFAVTSRGELRVRIRFAHVLERRNGKYGTVVPLRALADREVPRASFSVDARSDWPVGVSLTRGFPFERLPHADPRRYRAAFTATEFRPRRDLDVRWEPVPRGAGLTLDVQAVPGAGRFFMAVVAAGDRALANPDLRIEGVKAADVSPARLRTLPKDRVAHVFGRIVSRGDPVGVLRGRRGGADLERRTTAMPKDAGFIPALWAHEQIREILEDAGGRPSAERRKEIVALSKRYGILTEQTALLAK